jgi:hypothetical protein
MDLKHVARSVSGLLVHVGALALGYFAALALFPDANNLKSIAALTAWWTCLYLGYLFRVRLKVLIQFFFLYVGIVIVDIIGGYRWFYPEGATTDPISYVLLSLIGFVFLGSPLVVNAIVSKVIQLLQRL